jgi:hypothetical protein
VPPFEEDEWAPYDTTKNFAEVHDLSEEHPDKLRELIELWWTEAEKYNVLPLEDRGGELFVLKRTRVSSSAAPRPFPRDLAPLRTDDRTPDHDAVPIEPLETQPGRPTWERTRDGHGAC